MPAGIIKRSSSFVDEGGQRFSVAKNDCDFVGFYSRKDHKQTSRIAMMRSQTDLTKGLKKQCVSQDATISVNKCSLKSKCIKFLKIRCLHGESMGPYGYSTEKSWK